MLGEKSKEKKLDKYEKKVKQVGGKKIKNKCVRAFTLDIIYVICWQYLALVSQNPPLLGLAKS